MLSSIIVLTVMIINGCSKQKEEDKEPISFTDTRDGKTYKTIKIGAQTWFAENLNYKIGTSICYEKEPVNCEIYGRLYDWNTAMSACPEGWHLPDDNEWKNLEMYLGMSQIDADRSGRDRGTDEGTKIKSISGWLNDHNGTDSIEFNAIPSGYGMKNVYFSNMGKYANWWTSTDSVESGIEYAFAHYVWASPTISKGGYGKDANFSIRCLKD